MVAPDLVKNVEQPTEATEAEALTPEQLKMCADAGADPVKYAATLASIKARSGGKGA